MNIGYSYWGLLGDYKEDKDGNSLSTPDGNASYSWSIIYEAQKRGHTVWTMQEDRDLPAFKKYGKNNFSSFSQEKRFEAYCSTLPSRGGLLPDLDILLLEWRFLIPGRNDPRQSDLPGWQPDLKRQTDLLNYYGSLGVPIVIFDLDHKLDEDAERTLLDSFGPIFTVFETSTKPLRTPIPRVRVEIPFVISDLLQISLKPVDDKRKMSYVGSRYERDDVIDEWIKPLSDRWPGQIEFWGNWTADYNFSEVQARWPNINYRDRITMKDFDKAYNGTAACPLIAKKSYLKQGFVTARLWETLLFGTIPLGLASHTGIDQYLPQELIVKNADDLGNKTEWLSQMNIEQREELRRVIVKKIEFMDVKNFLDKLEGVRNG